MVQLINNCDGFIVDLLFMWFTFDNCLEMTEKIKHLTQSLIKLGWKLVEDK